MGQVSRHEERGSRFPMRATHRRPHPAAAPTRKTSRLLRYGLRALVVAGAAGAAWLVGSQVASASAAHDTATPAHADAAPTHQQCATGLVPAATHAVHVVAGALTTQTSGGASAGAQTCGRPTAGPHDETVRTAPVANSTRAGEPAARGAAPAPVSAGHHAGTRPARPSTSQAGSSTGQLPLGPLADAAGPVLGPVADATRPTTGPVTDVVRPAGVLNQSPVPAVLTDVARPVVATIADTARPVTRPLAGPLATATRPVTGLLGAAVHPLPGVAGGVTAPLTGVLTGGTGPLSGTTLPTGHAAPSQASHWPYGAVAKALSLCRQADPVHAGAGRPSATWTSTSAASADRSSGHHAPGVPEPSPLPAGSGLSSGGSASSSASHADTGAFAPAASSAVRTDTPAGVGPATAPIGLPRLYEVDPVVTPD